MDRKQAKLYVKNQEPRFLKEAPATINEYQSYICPCCQSGSGKNGTGLAIIPESLSSGEGRRYKCFACGLNADNIQLYKLVTGIQDDFKLFQSIYTYYGIQIDDTTTPHNGNRKSRKAPQVSNTPQAPVESTPKAKALQDQEQRRRAQRSFMEKYIKVCHEKVNNTDYFKNRGLSEAIIKKYRLGYDEKCFLANKSKNKPGSETPIWKAVVIPTSDYSVIFRNTDPEASGNNRYRKRKVDGERMPLFNEEALNGEDPVFIVEGEFDALSFIEIGYKAVALGTTGNQIFVDRVNNKPPKCKIILALDNDPDKKNSENQIKTPGAGKKATSILSDDLSKIGIAHSIADVEELYGGYKDANEFLVKDREGFIEAVKEQLLKINEAERKEITESYNSNFLDSFAEKRKNADATKKISTGFRRLDYILQGGLRPGLYLIGAVPGLGKTTFTLQMADYMASLGYVIYMYALEMSREELMAKSISRETFLYVKEPDNGCSINEAQNTMGILDSWKGYSPKQLEVIDIALDACKEYAGRIVVKEGMGKTGLQQIWADVLKHKEITGEAPVVIVDYLQIMKPRDPRATDKMNIDEFILGLKALSKRLETPVIAISSYNRAGYDQEADFKAFKESGAIEYGADFIIGLQYQDDENPIDDNSDDPKDGEDEAKDTEPKNIELKVLKNRFGRSSKGKHRLTISYDFYEAFNYYEEWTLEEDKALWEQRKLKQAVTVKHTNKNWRKKR